MKCPNCGYIRTDSDKAPRWMCPSCEVAYNKFIHQSGNYKVPPERPPIKEEFSFDPKWYKWIILIAVIILIAPIIKYISNKGTGSYGTNFGSVAECQTYPLPIDGSERVKSAQIVTKNMEFMISPTHEQIQRGAIEESFPIDGKTMDKKFEAKLYWLIRWNYEEVREGEICKVNRVRSKLYLSHAYPKLADGLVISSEDRKLFDDYLSRLVQEQNEHGKNAITIADAIPVEIAAFPGFGDCHTLRKIAQQRVYAIEQKLKVVNEETPEDYFVKDFKTSIGLSSE